MSDLQSSLSPTERLGAGYIKSDMSMKTIVSIELSRSELKVEELMTGRGQFRSDSVPSLPRTLPFPKTSKSINRKREFATN